MVKVREIVFYDKCCDFFWFCVRVGFSVDNKCMCIRIVCDLYFVVVKDVFVVVFFSF